MAVSESNDVYTLSVTPEPNVTITRVVFPRLWALPVDPNNPSAPLTDDINIGATFHGVATTAVSSIALAGLYQLETPDPNNEQTRLFAPFAIRSNGTRSVLIGARDWPPRGVKVIIDEDEVDFNYEPVSLTHPGTYSFSFSVHRSASGAGAWRTVVNEYRDWRRSQLAAEGLDTVVTPNWIKRAQGFMNWQLENQEAEAGPGPTTGDHYNELEKYKAHLRWYQCWGQMSRRTNICNATPDPNCGCCDVQQAFHPRYLDANAFPPGSLYDLINEVRGSGLHIGFYSRPDPALINDTLEPNSAALSTWLNWIGVQESAGADAYYYDQMGVKYLGSTITIGKILRDVVQPAALVEGALDTQPVAYLSSLRGAGVFLGGAGRTIDDLGPNVPAVTFTNLGSYYFRDREAFIGHLNTDGVLFGAGASYWGERQAFLHGMKLALSSWWEAPNRTPNPLAMTVLRERNRIRFWCRGFEYCDKEDISAVQGRIDVRKFVDAGGNVAFAIDRWLLDPNDPGAPDDAHAQFTYNGAQCGSPVTINVPFDADDKLVFIELVDECGGLSVCDTNGNGIPDNSENTTYIYDVNSDGTVDIGDLSGLLAVFGKTSSDPAFAARFDFDCSGVIDLADLSAVSSAFGQTWDANSVICETATGSVQHTVSILHTDLGSGSAAFDINVPAFDYTLGVLDRVEVSFEPSFGGLIELENRQNGAASFDLDLAWSASIKTGTHIITSADANDATTIPLATYDGTTDFAGGSGAIWSTGATPIASSLNAKYTQMVPGHWVLTVDAQATPGILATPAGAFDDNFEASIQGNIRVTYYYTSLE